MTEQALRARGILFAVFILPLFLYFLFAFFSTPSFSSVPKQYKISTTGDTTFFSISNLPLVDQEGNVFNLQDFKGKITLLSFMTERDTLITKIVNAHLQFVFENFKEGSNLSVLTINLDSTSLSNYAASRELDQIGWTFAHGDPEEIYAVAKDKIGIEDYQNKDFNLPLTARQIALVDKDGLVRKYYAGTDLAIYKNINEDLRTLLRLEYPEELGRR